MSCVPVETSSLELGPRDYLNEFLTLISTLRGGQAKYVPPLLEKVDAMLSTVSGPIIPPLIYETSSTVDGPEPELEQQEHVEGWELNENSLSSSYATTNNTFRTPPTLSTSSSDMSEFSLLSGTESVPVMIPALPELYDGTF